MAMTGTEPVSAENLKALSGMLEGVKLIWSGNSTVVSIDDYAKYALFIVCGNASGSSQMNAVAIVPSDFNGQVIAAHDPSYDTVIVINDGAGTLRMYQSGGAGSSPKIYRVYGITGGGWQLLADALSRLLREVG